MKTDDKGVEHYEVGPETISCEASLFPKFVLNPEFLTAVNHGTLEVFVIIIYIGYQIINGNLYNFVCVKATMDTSFDKIITNN